MMEVLVSMEMSLVMIQTFRRIQDIFGSTTRNICRVDSDLVFRARTSDTTPRISFFGDGSAEFGSVAYLNTNGVRANSQATLVSYASDGTTATAALYGDGKLLLGNNTSAPNITLNANGRIECLFDSKFRLGVGETGSSGTSNSFGQVAHTFNGFDGYTSYSDSDLTETARITCTDGSAFFSSGKIALNADGSALFRHDDSVVYDDTASQDTTIKLQNFDNTI